MAERINNKTMTSELGSKQLAGPTFPFIPSEPPKAEPQARRLRAAGVMGTDCDESRRFAYRIHIHAMALNRREEVTGERERGATRAMPREG